MATSLRSYTVTVPTKSRHVNHPICHTNLEIEGPCDQHLSLLSLFQIQSNGMAAWLCHTDHPWWRTCKAPVSGSVARRFKTTLAAKCLHVRVPTAPTAVRIYVDLFISKQTNGLPCFHKCWSFCVQPIAGERKQQDASVKQLWCHLSCHLQSLEHQFVICGGMK